MTTDFRALCAELADALHNAIRVIYTEDGTLHISTAEPVLERARAALAEHQPELPTDEELMEVFWGHNNGMEELWAGDWLAAARTVLARWGNS